MVLAVQQSLFVFRCCHDDPRLRCLSPQHHVSARLKLICVFRSRSSVRKTGRVPLSSSSAVRSSSSRNSSLLLSAGQAAPRPQCKYKLRLYDHVSKPPRTRRRHPDGGVRHSGSTERRSVPSTALCPLVLVQTQQTFRRLKVDSTHGIKSLDVVQQHLVKLVPKSFSAETFSEALRPKSGTATMCRFFNEVTKSDGAGVSTRTQTLAVSKHEDRFELLKNID